MIVSRKHQPSRVELKVNKGINMQNEDEDENLNGA